MATQSNAMVALQTAAGLNFGHVRRVSPTEMVFEADARLDIGDEVPWRLELLGWKETVMGSLTVRQVQPRQGDVPIFYARIDSIKDTDRPLFDTWLRDSELGGVSRRYDENPESLVGSNFDAPMRGASHTETTAALERLARRRAQGRKHKERLPGEDSDPFGLGDEKPSDTSSAPAGSGRRAIREALRASLGQQRPRGPRTDRDRLPERWISGDTPSDGGSGAPGGDQEDASDPNTYSGSGLLRPLQVPDWLDSQSQPSAGSGSRDPSWLAELHSVSNTDSVANLRSETPSWLYELNPSPAAEPPAADDGPHLVSPEDPTEEATERGPHRAPDRPAAPDPMITVDAASAPTRVTAAWRTRDAYARDFRQHLRGCGLFVPEPDMGALGTEVEVLLVLPGGLEVSCKATVVAPMIMGTGLALSLGEKDRRALSLAADAASPHAPGS